MTATPTAFTSHGSGSGLAALSYTCAVDTAVAAGTGAIVQTAIRYLASQPGAPSLTDTKGNTWTRDDDGGSSLVPLTTFRSNCVNGLTTSDTLTVTYVTNNCDAIIIAGLQTVGSSIARSGAVGGVVSLASSATHSYNSAANTSADLMISGDAISGVDQTAYSSTNVATHIQTTGSGTNRALAQQYSIPGNTTAHQTDVVWTSAHVGSMCNLTYTTTVLANTAAGSITLGGAGTGQAAGTATGSVTLGGSATAKAAATATGSVTLSGTAATVVLGVTGSLALNATASTVVLGITGSVTLGGSATGTAGSTNTATGSLTLAGSSTAAAQATATGSLTLTGTANWTVQGIAGSITLTGAGTVQAAATATGSVTLTGATTGNANPTATGSITLAGAATATSTATHTTPTPTGRVIHVPAETRVIRIPSETRVITIPPAGSRVILVTA